MEILRYLRLYALNGKLQYWRDHNGAEVDYVVEVNRKYIPIEVKWTKTPNPNDVIHLQTFQEEYDCYAMGYLICRCAKPLQLTPRILALPWQELQRLVEIFEGL